MEYTTARLSSTLWTLGRSGRLLAHRALATAQRDLPRGIVQQGRERWGSPAGLPFAHGPRPSVAIEMILQALGPSAPKWLAQEHRHQGSVTAVTTSYCSGSERQTSEKLTG